MASYKILILFLLVLTSCVYVPKWEWHHDHRSAAERDADFDYCRKAVNRMAWGGGFLTSPASFHIFQEEKDAEKVRCMQDMGYEAVRADS